MKIKITILILALVVLTANSWAQPIITGIGNPPIGGRLYAYVIPGSIIPGSAGANQTWDYSAIVHDTSTFYFENISYSSLSTAMQDTFPTGNMATKYVSGGVTIAKLVFELRATDLLYLGVNTLKFPTPDTQLVFPHNYLETHAGAFYDAYGTLITPFGTFTNVIRLREISGSNYKYDYYQFNPFEMIFMEYLVDTVSLAVSGQMFLDTDLTWVGIAEESGIIANSGTYPNPSNGLFTCFSSINMNEIKIYNVFGENIYSKKVNTTKSEIDLSDKSKGVYFYQLIGDQQVIKTGKIIIE